MFSFVLSLFFYRLCLVCPIQLRWTNKFPRNFLSCFVFNSKTKTKKKRTRRNISIRCVRFSVFCEFCVCCTFFFSPSIGSVWKVDVFFIIILSWLRSAVCNVPEEEDDAVMWMNQHLLLNHLFQTSSSSSSLPPLLSLCVVLSPPKR